MRIASYNILSGGFSSYSRDIPYPERMSLLQQAVCSLKADILILIDTFRWEEMFPPAELTRLFGYPYCYSINLNDKRLMATGHNNGITILSRVPTHFSTLSLGTRDAVQAVFTLQGKKIDLYGVYLDDLSETVRLQQIASLLSQLHPYIPTIIMGDMNTFSPHDTDVTQRIRQFLTERPTFASFEPVLRDMERAEVLGLLEEKGFVDIHSHHPQYTLPTPLFPACVAQPFLRVDFILGRDITLQPVIVDQGNVFTKTSDHYPVMGELSF